MAANKQHQPCGASGQQASFLHRRFAPCSRSMQVHASCVCRGGAGVLLLGPSGCGKSDLVLRLLECGFVLVADDRVDIVDLCASAPDALAGLLEVRGLGILKLSHVKQSRLALIVALDGEAERLPEPRLHEDFGLPMITIDPKAASATARVSRALDCAIGHTTQIAGAFQQ